MNNSNSTEKSGSSLKEKLVIILLILLIILVSAAIVSIIINDLDTFAGLWGGGKGASATGEATIATPVNPEGTPSGGEGSSNSPGGSGKPGDLGAPATPSNTATAAPRRASTPTETGTEIVITPKPNPTDDKKNQKTPTAAASPTPGITPTPTPTIFITDTPVILASCGNGFSAFPIEISWYWPYELGPNQYFDIKVKRKGMADSVAFDWAKSSPFLLDVPGLPAGEYVWTVQLLQGHIKGNEKVLDRFIGAESGTCSFNWTPNVGEERPSGTP